MSEPTSIEEMRAVLATAKKEFDAILSEIPNKRFRDALKTITDPLLQVGDMVVLLRAENARLRAAIEGHRDEYVEARHVYDFGHQLVARTAACEKLWQVLEPPCEPK